MEIDIYRLSYKPTLGFTILTKGVNTAPYRPKKRSEISGCVHHRKFKLVPR